MLTVNGVRLASVLKKSVLVLGLLAMPALAQTPVGTEYIYKTVDARTMRLWVLAPAGHTVQDHTPAIVFYHGGGYVGGAPSSFNRQATYLAGRGMVAVQVDYRRSHAVQLGIDPNRIAAAGGSAGGQLAAFLGLVDGVVDDPGDDPTISVKPN